MTKALLYDSESLTREEETLRIELIQWARGKYLAGSRPVPITAAIMIAGKTCEEDDRLIFAK